jgi:hypothetical protein
LDKKPAALLPDPRTVLLAKFDISESWIADPSFTVYENTWPQITIDFAI